MTSALEAVNLPHFHVTPDLIRGSAFFRAVRRPLPREQPNPGSGLPRRRPGSGVTGGGGGGINHAESAMHIRPIRTDADHEAALRDIESLWGADAGTEAGDRLDVLVTLVEAYEAKRWPIARLDPAKAFKLPWP